MLEKAAPMKRLSPLGMWALALGGIIGWGAFVMPGTTFLPQAGPVGTALGMTVGAIIMLMFAANLRFLMMHNPVNGGAFAYALEAFGRNHAFACGWMLLLAYLSIAPQNVTALSLVARTLMGGWLEHGWHYTVAGYDTYIGEIILMIVVIAAVSFVLVRGGDVANTAQSAVVVCLAAGVLIVAAANVMNPSTSLESLAPAFSPDVAPGFGVLAIAAIAPFAFVGFDMISQATSELRFPVRKTGPIMFGAIIMGAFTYITLTIVAASVVPAGYDGWPAYVSNTAKLEGLAAFPLFNAVYTTMGDIGLVVLLVTALCAVISGIVASFFATSRLLGAMEEEGMLPAWFGVRNRKYGTPHNAILFMAVVSIFMSLFGRTILGWIFDMTSVGTALAFVYVSAATWKSARRMGNTALSITGLVGAVFSVAFLLLLVIPLPVLDLELDMESLVCLVAWIALGLNTHTPFLASSSKLEIDNRLTRIDSVPD